MFLSLGINLLLTLSATPELDQKDTQELFHQYHPISHHLEDGSKPNICDIDPTAGGCQVERSSIPNICDIDPTAGGCQANLMRRA